MNDHCDFWENTPKSCKNHVPEKSEPLSSQKNRI